MRAYELMIIFDGDLDEEAISSYLSNVVSAVESEDGKVASSKDTEPWGRRKFTYRINHKWEGFYVVLEIVTQAANIDSSDRLLRLADRSEIVRHKIIRLYSTSAARFTKIKSSFLSLFPLLVSTNFFILAEDIKIQ